MAGKNITDQQIVDIYMQSYLKGTSLKVAADKLGVSPQYIDWRAKKLRKAGVKLPKKHATPSGIDVDALNSHIDRILKEPS